MRVISILLFVVMLLLLMAGCGKKKDKNDVVQSVNGAANISIVNGETAVSSMNVTVKTVNGQSFTSYEVGDQIIIVCKGDKLAQIINAGMIANGDTVVVVKAQQ